MKVLLDPGHGGKDPGAIDNGLIEKHLNLIVAHRVQSQLQAAGVECEMTRTLDVDVSMETRIAAANQPDIACVVSIHHNAATNPDANGIEVFHSRVGGEGKRLAEFIYSALMNLGLERRGVKTRLNDEGKDYYAIIRETRPPAVIVECGFLTSQKDAARLADDRFLLDEARAIAAGIRQWLGVSEPEQEIVPIEEYRRVVDALEIAEEKLGRIKEILG